MPMAKLRSAVQRFAAQPSPPQWVRALKAVEQALDQAVQPELAQWHFIQLARQSPDVRQRLVTLLRLEAVHRQAGLQTYLSSPRLQCAPHEVREAITHLRHEAVAAKVLALLEHTEPLRDS